MADRADTERTDEERYRLATELYDALVWDWDLTTGRQTRSRPAAGFLGYAPSEVHDATSWWQTLVHPEDIDRVMQWVNDALESGAQRTTQSYRFKRRDGTYALVEDRVNIVYREGQPVRIVACLRDITATVDSQHELERSEARFRTLAEAIPEAIFVFGPEGLMEYANPAFTQWTGYTLEQYNEMRMRVKAGEKIEPLLVHPEDTDKVRDAVARLTSSHEPMRLEYRLRQKSGEYRWTFGNTVPVPSSVPGAIPTRYVGSLTDVDDRRRLESLLREKASNADRQQKWVESVLEALPVPVLLIAHGDGDITYFNKAMEKTLFELTGESDRLVAATKLRRVDATGKDLPADQWPQARVSRGERILGDEITFIGALGRRTVNVYADEIPAVLDRPRASVVVYQDISRLKQAERELRDASEAKDRFLAVLSHELRTPLTPVLTLTQLLEKDVTLPAEARESIALMRRNVELEIKLIDDLLDMTRIIRGKLRLDLKPVDMRELLKSVAAICHSDLRGKAINFEIATGDVPLPVAGDAARLHQVFWNLLKNAIQFTTERGRVSVRAERVEMVGAGGSAQTPTVVIRLQDDGIGIPANLLPRVFDAFMQGDHDVRRHGGLGLGLAIAKALVELHGGTLTAKSLGPGKGAEFLATLPLKEAAMAVPALPSDKAPEGHAYRILLVEDHVDTARVMQRLLRRFGHTVSVVGNVAAAIAALQAETFDLLLSDIGLPDGSGYDLMRQTVGFRPPAIALSGFGMDDDLHRSKAAGFVDHLTKPIDALILEAAIIRVVQGAARERSAGPR